jgi:hypothetical protein
MFKADLYAAQLSQLSYLGSEAILKGGFYNITSIYDSNTDTESYVCENDDFLFFVVRGTEPNSLKDIRSGIQFFKNKTVSEFKLHTGFFEAWKGIAARVGTEVLERALLAQSAVEHDGKPLKRFIYCGHSLGGAVATIAAATHRPEQLITFGSPRVGGEKFARHIESLPTQKSDGVTLIPSIGYKHVGWQLHIGRDNKVDFNGKSVFRRLMSMIVRPRPFTDHVMSKYLDFITQEQSENA